MMLVTSCKINPLRIGEESSFSPQLRPGIHNALRIGDAKVARLSLLPQE